MKQQPAIRWLDSFVPKWLRVEVYAENDQVASFWCRGVNSANFLPSPDISVMLNSIASIFIYREEILLYLYSSVNVVAAAILSSWIYSLNGLKSSIVSSKLLTAPKKYLIPWD